MLLKASFSLACLAFGPVLGFGLDFGTAAKLFADVAQRNQVRESQLQKYSAVRTYQIQAPDGRVRGESRVLVRYESPHPKIFTILDEHGSHVIQMMVFRPLREHEAKSSAGADKTDSAVTPANYKVEMAGEADLDGRHGYLLSATPRRRDKYLFRGTLWIDAQDLAIAQIEGEPAKLPSFWVSKVHFVRRYRKIGDFWLPAEDTSVSDVKIFGRHTLTIRYSDYVLGDQTPNVASESAAAGQP